MPAKRQSPLEMSPDDFRAAGHQLVDDLAAFLESMPTGKVTESPQVADLQAMLGASDGRYIAARSSTDNRQIVHRHLDPSTV